tara:strand:- start:981 stop:1610 length:630 start_codon:yes stop_codon:yes gene_type:complete
MNKQKIFNFDFSNNNSNLDFYVNKTNIDAYNLINSSNNLNIYLKGPKKSGKSILSNIWLKINKGIIYENNFNYIINNKKNLLIDNINNLLNQEELFHMLNHYNSNNLKVLITSHYEINEIDFSLNDLTSRLKTFTYSKINNPDDDMLIHVLTKLFIEKQFIINSNEIFQFILKTANRSYEDMYYLVKKLDTLSIEKKRQLTIPLIKEIL